MTGLNGRNDAFVKKVGDEMIVVVNKARQLVANSIYEMLLDVKSRGGGINTAIEVLSNAIKNGNFIIKDGGKKDGDKI
jgi:hypothetical protein